jgi:membrane-associated protein
VGYSLLGYRAGSSFVVYERRVGVGVAVAVAAVVVALAVVWAIRRHQVRSRRPDS